MKRRFFATIAVILLMLALSVPAAHAALQRVGPVDPAIGYPAWYQDTTGLVLDSCVNLNQAELDGGWCLLLPVDVPSGTAPETFPTNFAEEHFYWSATGDASIGGTRALLVLGLEEAFGIGPALAGDQVVFGRLRIRITPLPFDGTYTVYTPFGKFVFADQLAGDPRGIFFTEDIGLAPGNFTDALKGRVGPFLLPSATPGGPEMPPLTAANPTPDTDPAHFGGAFAPTAYPGTGKSYIADPARIGPVTGSTLAPFVVGDGTTRDPNIFRIEGPNGFVTETFDFALSGRVFEGPIASASTVDRASYARSATAKKVDVYVTASPATQGRIPAGLASAVNVPQLAFYDVPCTATLDINGIPGPPFSAPVGAIAHQMNAAGIRYFGQSQPTAIPFEVCVQETAVDAAGQTVTIFRPAPLGDQIFITEALYDPVALSLSVKATSSDQFVLQTLTVEGFGNIDPATGQFALVPLLAPPDKVRVISTGRGFNDFQVTTGIGTIIPPANVPIAINDTATTPEDAATTINLLANDTNAVGGTVTLASQPLLGTALLVGDSVTYTPLANRNGTDSFTYTVTVGTQVSNTASVAVTITPLNDPPVAVNNSATAIANTLTPINVLANDTDVDGATDIVAVANLTQPVPVGATVALQADGRTVNFNATLAGAYTFTYQAQDAAGALSNIATVTVTVSGAETITIVNSFYRRTQLRLRVDGTINPAGGQTITLDYTNTAGTVLGRAGTVVSGATGVWAFDLRGITLPVGTSRVKVTSSNGTVRTATLIFQ